MDNMSSLLNLRVQLWVSLKVIFAHAPPFSGLKMLLLLPIKKRKEKGKQQCLNFPKHNLSQYYKG